MSIEEFSNNSRIPIVVDGSLTISTSQFQKVLEQNGFILEDNITRDTRYLICNEVSDSSKFRKAKTLGIEIVSEAKFRNTFLIGD